MECVPDRSETSMDKPKRAFEPKAESPNEAVVHLAFEELAPHVKVIRPSRPSLTYERFE